MDPLSILASSVAIAGAAQAGLSVLLRIYGAKTSLCALSNELSDFMVILKEVGTFSEKDKNVLNQNTDLNRIALITQDKLRDLDTEINKWITSFRKKRFKSILINDKVNDFRTNLRDHRSQFLAIISTSSAYVFLYSCLSACLLSQIKCLVISSAPRPSRNGSRGRPTGSTTTSSSKSHAATFQRASNNITHFRVSRGQVRIQPRIRRAYIRNLVAE